ncbi:MAG: hypothetical protein CM1200mP36_07730 [Gammaproteobacteria bacterium]|nr:MAG: hypothetical protein CM1200mP36_07730 [Gammaproteobacteria bacterium]
MVELCRCCERAGVSKARYHGHEVPHDRAGLCGCLKKYQLEHAIPDEEVRDRIDRIIFTELVSGVFLEESRQYFNWVFEELKADGAMLSCLVVRNPATN